MLIAFKYNFNIEVYFINSINNKNDKKIEKSKLLDSNIVKFYT